MAGRFVNNGRDTKGSDHVLNNPTKCLRGCENLNKSQSG